MRGTSSRVVIKLFGNVWIVLGLVVGAMLFLPKMRHQQTLKMRTQLACVSAACLAGGMAFAGRPAARKK